MVDVNTQVSAPTLGASLQLRSESRREQAAGLIVARRFWSGPSDPAIITQARHAVAEFVSGHVSAARLDDIRLCVSEAVTNAVAHGFAEGRVSGLVTVSASFERGALVIVITDDGQGLKPDSANAGLGLGLPLIAALADDSSVANATSKGTQVSMRFSVAGCP